MGGRVRGTRMGVQWWAVDRSWLNRPHAVASGRREIGLWEHTDLVVEGYPRSANTLLGQGLMVMNPGLQVASRSHGTGLIRRALAQQVPVVLTLRRPEEAVPSCAAYLGIGLSQAARRYAQFHEAVLPLGLPCIDFETIIDTSADIGTVIAESTGLSVRWPSGAASRFEMQERIDRRYGQHPPTSATLVEAARTSFGELPLELRSRAEAAYQSLHASRVVVAESRAA